jgi:predicted permease
VAALLLSSVALLVVAVLPAWKVAQQALTDAIKDGGHGVSRVLDRAFVRRLMLAAQVAGSCLLLVVAGLMVRGIQRVVRADVGFDYAQAAVLSMPLGRYGISGESVVPYWHDVKTRVLAHPEVESAAIVTAAPLGGRVYEVAYADTPGLEALQQSVDPEYFSVMRIPLISGRTFRRDDADAVIVSRRLALEMYGTLDVVGRRFPRSKPADTIVGVAADAHTIKVVATNVAELYRPLRESDFSLVYLVARGRSDPARLLPVLREAARLDPRVIPAVRLMRDDFDRRVRGSRLAGTVASGIGAATLLLACLGIFGVVSYGVALRTKEIGIRTALGADRGRLLRAILRQVLWPVAAGMMVGVGAAIPIGLALSGDPFYLSPGDPVAFVAALSLFVMAAFVAAVWPAARAIRGNPLDALRHS